jgi:signal transduction histidine kinase
LRVPELDRAVARRGGGSVPLLAFRLPALERTAWQRGLRAARSVEKRAAAAFATAAARVLRDDDLLAHDRGSDVFLAALTAPGRAGPSVLAPLDIRSASARIAATVGGLTALDVDVGWTHYDVAAGIDAAVRLALARGAQERERYAFFSAVGHELRTPLASIRGYLETLLAGGIDRATRRRFAGIAYNESLRLARLVDGMFEISLLDLTAAAPSRAAAELGPAVAAAADACAASAAAHGIELRVGDVPTTGVALDGDRLVLVLVNLIENAIKHGRRGGRVEVAFGARNRRTVTVTVDDDGPGIPCADRERIFALAERGATAAPGSGIGLALVRLLLERIGGRVDVGTAPLGGARFSVILPRPGATPTDSEALWGSPLGRRRSTKVATDFRSGRDFPRRGRDEIEGFLWLGRVFDKARASRDGTIHDYIYPCPMDRGVFDRWGITSRMFDAALDTCDSDAEIVTWLKARVTEERRNEANRWLLDEKQASMDKQDAEEGVVPA